MHEWLGDLRSGVRMLLVYPTLSLVAVVTLGVGIGLSTTVFSVVNGALFKGLPFPDSGRIVALMARRTAQNQGPQPLSVHDLAVFQERQTSFEQIGAYGFTPSTCRRRRAAERLRGQLTARRISGARCAACAGPRLS
jgi:hypothetical protein